MVPDVRGDARARKTDKKGRGGYSSRDSDANRRLCDKASKGDKECVSSRGSRGNTTRKSAAEGRVGGYSPERDKKSRNNPDDVDEVERDRCKVAEIMCRIEERKVTKKSDVAHGVTTDGLKSVPGTGNKTKRGKREDDDVTEVITREMAAPSEVSKKTSTVRRDTVGADTAQRDAAMQWAAGGTSDTNIVTQSKISGKAPYVNEVPKRQLRRES